MNPSAYSKLEEEIEKMSLVSFDEFIPKNTPPSLLKKVTSRLGSLVSKITRYLSGRIEFRYEDIRMREAAEQSRRSTASWNFFEDEITKLTERIKLNPKDTAAYRERALLYSTHCRKEEAMEDYNKILELDPKDAKTFQKRGYVYSNLYRGIGDTYSKLGKEQEAIQNFTRSIELNPTNSHTYLYRGISLAKIGKHLEAIEDFKRALKLNPENYHIYTSIGDSKAKLGMLKDAITNYNITIEAQPDSIFALCGRGAALAVIGKHKWALEDFTKVITLEREFRIDSCQRGIQRSDIKPLREFLDLYSGLSNLNHGRYQEAITNFEDAKLFFQHFRFYGEIGIAKAHLGRLDEAISDFEKSDKEKYLGDTCTPVILESLRKIKEASSSKCPPEATQ